MYLLRLLIRWKQLTDLSPAFVGMSTGISVTFQFMVWPKPLAADFRIIAWHFPITVHSKIILLRKLIQGIFIAT